MIQILTISALERATGASRSTIHYYIREGLLPQPQKTATSRALYTQDHISLLEKIGELKSAGLTLAEIKDSLSGSLEKIAENSVDLAVQESQRVRQAILRVATEEFATKGYKQTHVATIIGRLGITPHVFYAQFPSKRQLLMECFNTFIKWNLASLEPKLVAGLEDFGERLLWRLWANFRVHALGTDVLTLVRSEGIHGESDLRKPVEEAWGNIAGRIVDDLKAMRSAGSASASVPDELISYSLIGAFDSTLMRSTWDDKYTREDLLRTHLYLFLALQAAESGEIDIASRLARYEDLIAEVAHTEPANPPALDE